MPKQKQAIGGTPYSIIGMDLDAGSVKPHIRRALGADSPFASAQGGKDMRTRKNMLALGHFMGMVAEDVGWPKATDLWVVGFLVEGRHEYVSQHGRHLPYSGSAAPADLGRILCGVVAKISEAKDRDLPRKVMTPAREKYIESVRIAMQD
ncbi:hypothetical protein GE09DRAFT_1232188 [Coniochaeta sp. 2T2.1]|nr:hypothetical protein GE09DRAFT_1232188 [Coniochaeta sp. 2T2.1]